MYSDKVGTIRNKLMFVNIAQTSNDFVGDYFKTTLPLYTNDSEPSDLHEPKMRNIEQIRSNYFCSQNLNAQMEFK